MGKLLENQKSIFRQFFFDFDPSEGDRFGKKIKKIMLGTLQFKNYGVIIKKVRYLTNHVEVPCFYEKFGNRRNMK